MTTETARPTFRELLHNAHAYVRSLRMPTGALGTSPRRSPDHARIVCLTGLQGYSTERRLAHLHALEQLTRHAATRRADRASAAAFMDALLPALEARRREHGHAYVTWREAQQLTRYGLRQPGHTWYRYSTPAEDLSDAAQLGTPKAGSADG